MLQLLLIHPPNPSSQPTPVNQPPLNPPPSTTPLNSGTHRRIQRIQKDNKFTLRVPTTSNGIRNTPEVVSLPLMTPPHQLFPSRSGQEDDWNDNVSTSSSSSANSSVNEENGIINRSVTFGVSRSRPTSAQLAGILKTLTPIPSHLCLPTLSNYPIDALYQCYPSDTSYQHILWIHPFSCSKHLFSTCPLFQPFRQRRC